MIVSVMPTYNCNGHCPFCYLGDQLITQEQLIDLQKLEHAVCQLAGRYSNLEFNVFGGEISLLPAAYIDQLIQLLTRYTSSSISVTSNFANYDIVTSLIDCDNVDVAISLNKERGHLHYNTIDNIRKLNQCQRSRIIATYVVLPSLLHDVDQFVGELIDLDVRRVLLLQYYPGVLAKKQYCVSNKQYCDFMINIIDRLKNYNITITNLSIDANVDQSSNIFINPDCEYCVTKYDENGFESFVTVTLDQFDKLIKLERARYLCICGQCEYFNKCFAEHFKPWLPEDTCVGHKKLCEFLRKD